MTVRASRPLPIGTVRYSRPAGEWQVITGAQYVLASFRGAHARTHAAICLRALRNYWRRLERKR